MKYYSGDWERDWIELGAKNLVKLNEAGTHLESLLHSFSFQRPTTESLCKDRRALGGNGTLLPDRISYQHSDTRHGNIRSHSRPPPALARITGTLWKL